MPGRIANSGRELNKKEVGLLGTCYTMTQTFYVDVLKDAGIGVLIPEGADIRLVNDIIFDELCVGTIREVSKEHLLHIIEGLCSRGAQGVIFGCTEPGLLVSPVDVDLPVFDTAIIHAEEAALEALR